MLGHVDPQSVKTRSPIPNPTVQAQSKHCLSLFTKTQNIIKILPAGLPNPMLFWYLFRGFSTQVFKGFGNTPQSAKKTQNLSPTGAKMAPRSVKLEPRSPPKYQKDTNMYSKFPKSRRECHTRASRSLTMLQKHHQATQSALGKTPRCKKNTYQPPAAGC